MGNRRGDDETRPNRTRRYIGASSPRRGPLGRDGGERPGSGGRGYQNYPDQYPDDRRYYGPYYDRQGARFYEDEYGHRYYDDTEYEGRYHRGERDHERERERDREQFWREREARQQTRRTVYKVLGGVCVALIALVAVLALFGDDPAQPTGSPGQVAEQEAPQQAPQPVPQQQEQQDAPQQLPEQAPQPGLPDAGEAPSSEEVQGQIQSLREDMEQRFAEIRQGIADLRQYIVEMFGSGSPGTEEQNGEEGSE